MSQPLSGAVSNLRGVLIGAGYFSQFHADAWGRLPDVDLVAVCDADPARAQALADRYGIARTYADAAQMLEAERPDFVDIATPPATHHALVEMAAARGMAVICQKPLAPTIEEARALIAMVEASGIRFMAHDNFRFQPWHREIRRQIDAGAIGRVQNIRCRTRMGDGWGEDAYLDRQPYFRTMPQLLIHETGIHFLDIFRFLNGEITRCFARIDRLNPQIMGEDQALVLCEFANGALGVWDANRYHPAGCANPRYTFGEFWIEGDRGSLHLDMDGRLRLFRLGDDMGEPVDYAAVREGFAGDSVLATFEHFIGALRGDVAQELTGADYLLSLELQEAAYLSSAGGGWVEVGRGFNGRR